MLKGRTSLKNTLLLSLAIHGFIFIIFSVATVKEFYPQTKYLEISLVSPSRINYARLTSFPPIEKASYKRNGQIPPNFFYRIRKASLEISITNPQDTAILSFSSSQPIEQPVINKTEKKIVRVLSPGYQYWLQRIAVEKEVKLRVHLSPDGRVNWIGLNTSTGDPILDALIKEEVSRWKFEPSYQHD